VRIGFLVNPVAGVGGPAGLWGSDTPEIRARAARLGYASRASERASLALSKLRDADAHWLTGAGAMGEHLVRELGFSSIEVLSGCEPPTTAATTRQLVRRFADSGVQLVVFAGGDGTARDIAEVVGTDVPVLGIPAGVKMRSGCFGVTPAVAGAIVARVIDGSVSRYREVEVVDLAGGAYNPCNAGDIGAGSALFGYCNSPDPGGLLLQSPKARRDDDRGDRRSIAREAAARLSDADFVVCGPGRTVNGVLAELGCNGSLLGVDVYDRSRGVLEANVTEQRLFEVLDAGRRAGRRAALVVGVIGGQGSLFGRGNQQLSARVVGAVGFGNVLVVASVTKLANLAGRPLLVDWDGPKDAGALPRFLRVIAGRGVEVVYPISSG
jgi:predicted polyphosphate/ATP-dependent NAD kinase